MRPEQLSDALGHLSEKTLEETATLRENPKSTHKTSHRNLIFRFGELAVCLALVLFAGFKLLPLLQGEEPVSGELPLLTMVEESFGEGGVGGETYYAFDISELTNANPWTPDAKLSTLPVYKNSVTHNDNHQLQGGDFDKMRELLLDVAKRLGLDTETLSISDDVPSAYQQAVITEKFGGNVPEGYFDPTALKTKTDGVTIEVDATLTAKITFDPAIPLPEKYNFEEYAPYEDVEQAANYLKKEFRSLLNMKKPTLNLYAGGYNINFGMHYYTEFFEGKGNLTEQIINYNFNRVHFACSEDTGLWLARVYQPDLSQKLGDYPLLSVEEAIGLLMEGNCYTTHSCEVPGEEYIAKVELMYRTGEYEEYFMPYYRFYVELPDYEYAPVGSDGIKSYGIFYVPAVKTEYISNLPAAVERG